MRVDIPHYQAVIHKLESRYERNFLEEINKTMKFVRYTSGRFFLEVDEVVERERPPMIELPEYRAKIGLHTPENPQ